ncbi:MAG: 4Fe-4S binding protein [Nitrospirae bacterium]|nr:4Fe-4S binding protein [Nitrospirota bacterium]
MILRNPVSEKFRKWLVIRRAVQISVVALFLLFPLTGLAWIQGNIGAANLFGLSIADPLSILGSVVASKKIYVPALAAAGIVALFYFAVGGRAYCGYVCPAGFFFEISSSVRNLVLKALSRPKRSGWNLDLSPHIKYYTLIGVLAVSAVTGIMTFEIFSPIGLATRVISNDFVAANPNGQNLERFAAAGPSLGLLVLLGIALFEAVFSKQAWCRFVCPLGAFYSLVGRTSLLRVKIDHADCALCLNCQADCPAKYVLDRPLAKEQTYITMGDCTNCGSCIDACPSASLKFALRLPWRK